MDMQAWMKQLEQTLRAVGQAGGAGWGTSGWTMPPPVMPPSLAALPDLSSWGQGAEWSGIRFDLEQLQALQQRYLQDVQAIWSEALSPSSKAQPLADRRFAHEAWNSNAASHAAAALYLLNARTMMAMVDAAQVDEKTRGRLRFAAEQASAACSPSNMLAFNPEAQQKAIETKGESIAKGIKNLLADMQRGHLSMTDESQFEVGRNVGTTQGAVVFENSLMQLIEYKPLTKQVHEKPFLVIPPCINKFYILDLQPQNSLIRHLVDNGHRTFVISWRNPDESMSQVTWDDYIEHAAIKAIAYCADSVWADSPKSTKTSRKSAASKALPKDAINALGFCVGGTILGTALGVLAARGEQPVASATFLTTFLDFADTGVLDVFIDDNFVKMREMQFAKGGLLKGQELASTFSFLRPNDLVWNYVVGNYLKGETPPPFDLLYWNCDSTNLPGPMYAWYLRNTYFENNLKKPGKLTVCGEKLDLGKITIPAYIYGSREDHIVPITGAYASTQILTGKKRFVMGASGHIAGVINPPAAKKRSYWTGSDTKFPNTHAEWMKTAKEHPGSWWTDWMAWLKPQAGKMVTAPKQYSSKVIEPAPGRYVKVKA
jgi:polyhydroxyalkanoate synthase subunit PhaC